MDVLHGQDGGHLQVEGENVSTIEVESAVLILQVKFICFISRVNVIISCISRNIQDQEVRP